MKPISMGPYEVVFFMGGSQSSFDDLPSSSSGAAAIIIIRTSFFSAAPAHLEWYTGAAVSGAHNQYISPTKMDTSKA